MEMDKEIVFPPSILNPYLLHKSCGGKMTHKKFREILVQDLIVQ
jgi:hypothetical protein